MKNALFLVSLITFIFLSLAASSQTEKDLVEAVSMNGLMDMIVEFSGEDSTVVNGAKVLIKHRVSIQDNNIAADYLVEKLQSFGLDTEDINYSSGGRNVVATQLGTENPDHIYIICGHYDTTDDHGADDNASGTIAVLETARILSQYQFKNTIKYALWDEEEQGLIGARNYAQKAKSDGMDIKAVLNMDMMAYDSNNDRQYDIDVRSIADSYAIKNTLVQAVETYDLNLWEKVVDPGTPASDHFEFWQQGYSAVLLGEAWSVNDITPGYHSDNDRLSLFNKDYYLDMVKLCVAYTAIVGELVTSSTEELFDKSEIKIQPNPSNGNFRIDFGRFIQGEYEVINSIGKLINKDHFQNQVLDIDLSDKASGTYFLRFSNKSNESSTISIVKH